MQTGDLRPNPFLKLPQMQSDHLLLRPLSEEDSEAIYLAASDPLIWEQHPDPQRYQREIFEKNFLRGALDCGSALLVMDKNSGEVIGCSRFYEWNPEALEVAIGFTFIVRGRWGGGINGELKKLMLDYAFRHANKVWFHIGKDNWRSRKGTEKTGARFSHETKKIINGISHEYAYYSIDRTRYLSGEL
jgi:RimJ/RimL family protein N-acetyltransferase